MHHRSWPSLDDDALREEVTVAAEIIADTAGRPVDQVAFPFGSYDRRALRAARRAGFDRAYTVDGGTARPDSWLQSRHAVRHVDTPQSIERLGGVPQDGPVSKVVRSLKLLRRRWR